MGAHLICVWAAKRAKTSNKSDRRSRNDTVCLEYDTIGLEIDTVGLEIDTVDLEHRP